MQLQIIWHFKQIRF